MYLGLPKERGNTFLKMTGKMWVLVDGNLNLNYKITTLHERECQFLHLLVGAFLEASVKQNCIFAINIC